MDSITQKLGVNNKRYRLTNVLYYHKHKEEILQNIPKHGITILVRDNREFRNIIDEVYPLMSPDKTCFIYSQFSGYIIDKHKAYKQRTFDFVHLKDWHIEELHTSGHASKEALAAVCLKVNPRYAIIPIHRDGETDFRSLDITKELKDKVITKTPEHLIGGIKITIKQKEPA